MWERFGRTILIVAGAILLVALLIFFISRTRAQAEQHARADLFRGMVALNQGDATSAAPMLKELIDNSPGTQASRDAMLLLGDAMMVQKNTVEAAAWYQKYIEKSGGDRNRKEAGFLGLGAALEDGGRFGLAAEAYTKAADMARNDEERGRALLSAARCYSRGAQNQKAIELYQKIAALAGAEVPTRDAANMHLGELSVTTPTAP